jgi:HKD family nuclease
MPDIKLITENLADEVIPSIRKATGIYILTSFVMESGVRLLGPHLKPAFPQFITMVDLRLMQNRYRPAFW